MAVRGRVLAVSVVLSVLGASFVGVVAATGVTAGITPGHAQYPSGGTTVSGVGNDAAQDNAQLAEDLPATLSPSWHAQPPLAPQAANDSAVSIGAAQGRTVVVDEQYQAAYISGYVSSTGKLLWRRALNFPNPAVVVGGVVYVSSQDANGFALIQALRTTDGTVLWTAHPANGESAATMSVGSGLVVSGQTVIDQMTGDIEFYLPLAKYSDTNGNALVGDGRIFYNSARGVQADSLATGAILWATSKANSSGMPEVGALEPALHGGLLYLPAQSGNSGTHTYVLDPATGRLERSLPPSPLGIAFDGNVGIFDNIRYTQPDIISAVNLTTGHVYWTHTFGDIGTEPVSVWDPPVIENGLVWAETAADTGNPIELYALSEVTGATVSHTALACGAASGSDLAFAQHRLAVPSLCGVLTYVRNAN